ncbi:MAG: condensation domain-containing protein, partial [Candidatus Binatia bacterium]
MAEEQLTGMTDRARRELLARLLNEEGIALPAARATRVQERAGFPPLSFSQERLRFLDQLDPGNAAYNIARALRLKGVLDRQALARGIDEIVRRHEILRTVFPCADDRPIQQVLAQVKIDLPLVDLSTLPQPQRRVEASRVLSEETAGRFDLQRAPLIKARLIRIGKAEHVLLLVAHQMVCDGWSMNLLLREWAILYRS